MSKAKHIAEKRGEVRHKPDIICSFVISIVGLVAHVRIQRVERIHITPAWLERETAEDLATLRFIASPQEIFRELWIYTPKGTFRFLRVMADSLAEPGPVIARPLVRDLAVDYNGNFRFFRLAGADPVEIGRDGNPQAGSTCAGGNPQPLPVGENPPPAADGEGVPQDLPTSVDRAQIRVGGNNPTEPL